MLYNLNMSDPLKPETLEEQNLIFALQNGDVRPEFLESLVASIAARTTGLVSSVLTQQHGTERAESNETIVATFPISYGITTPAHFADLFLLSSGQVRAKVIHEDCMDLFPTLVEKDFIRRAAREPIPCPAALAEFLRDGASLRYLDVGTWRQERRNNLDQLLKS